MIATTLFGLETTLESELIALGATDTEILTRAVKFYGDQSVLYKSNLLLRTAIKVLQLISFFEAIDENDLYNKIKNIPWDLYFTTKQTFAIDATCSGDYFTHSKFIALKTKDAIVDQFRDKYQIRPNIDVENPDVRINVHISITSCTISLDSSGAPLGKRGYKLAQTEAPLSEILAAGIIMLTDWDKKQDLIDPMCGSGTFPIEAALIAQNIPAGRLRHFTFEKWNNFNAALWQKIKEDAEREIVPFNGSIMGHDIDQKAIEVSKENAMRAGVYDNIEFKKISIFDDKSTSTNSLIIINPPYGERLKEKEEIIPFYQEIGTKLKHSFNGCDAWILSGNIEAIKFIGLRPSRKIRLFNGPIECKLHKFELYRGSKRYGGEQNNENKAE